VVFFVVDSYKLNSCGEKFMSSNPWKASEEIIALLDFVKSKHHSPRLDDCRIAVCFNDSKPFANNKLNLGKLSRFSATAKLWQREKHEFCLSIPMELWTTVLDAGQREAYLDLMLTRLDMDYLPEFIEENGKKIKIVDEFGRTQYSNVPKEDKEGNIKWKIEPLDLEVFSKNVRKYGLWQDELMTFKEAIMSADGGDGGQV
jgi:hypothetical protein